MTRSRSQKNNLRINDILVFSFFNIANEFENRLTKKIPEEYGIISQNYLKYLE